VPGETPADELEVDVGAAHEDDCDQTAVAVDVSRNDVNDLVEDERRGQPLGGSAERLAKLGAVDPVEADADSLALLKDGDRVAVVDADDERVEGVGQVRGGGWKKARESRGGEGHGRNEKRMRFRVAAGTRHGTAPAG
jgi:hypothetical protein